ncbi:MAG: hypothetical protein FJ119_12135 [Deltaproteobacteria bacterium]|nr:hypothetical protein [Deltaproteobacteria bacterium]
MANQVITNSMPIGKAGDITRSGNVVVESFMQSSTLPLLKYGLPFAIDTGVITGIVDTHTGANVAGFLVRPYPQLAATNQDVDAATPPVYPAILNGLKSGYIAVSLQHGTSAKGGKVYVRTAATSSTRYQGGIEAAAAATVANGTITGTGTGTIACTINDAALVVPGEYRITLASTSQTSVVSVVDPLGNRLKDGVVGTEYVGLGITFTITAAGTMTAADYFKPVVTLTTSVIPGAYFTGVTAATGIVEVAYNV